jgi:hypothetical protein
MDPWFKLTTAERRRAERAAHKFSDDIGGHASNYRQTVPPMVHTNIKDHSDVRDATTEKPLAPKPDRC